MSNIFQTAYSALYKAFRKNLLRKGVNIGETADYPRVELHSFTEGEPMDKEMSVRMITLSVESSSNKGLKECVEMAEANIPRLLVDSVLINGGDFEIVGVIPIQLQDLTEVTESQAVIYHIIQQFNVYIQKVQ